METFSINPPRNFLKDGKRLLTVASFEATNSVLEITHENNSFAINTPEKWTPEGSEVLINNLSELLELRSQNDF